MLLQIHEMEVLLWRHVNGQVFGQLILDSRDISWHEERLNNQENVVLFLIFEDQALLLAKVHDINEGIRCSLFCPNELITFARDFVEKLKLNVFHIFLAVNA